MLVAPLTSIKQQLLEDCRKIGFSALVGDQVLSLWIHTSNSNSITSFLHIWMSDSPFLSCSQQTWKRSFWSAQQCFLSRPSSWRQLRWFSSAIAPMPFCRIVGCGLWADLVWFPLTAATYNSWFIKLETLSYMVWWCCTHPSPTYYSNLQNSEPFQTLLEICVVTPGNIIGESWHNLYDHSSCCSLPQ